LTPLCQFEYQFEAYTLNIVAVCHERDCFAKKTKKSKLMILNQILDAFGKLG
jgi:hypothetical protein|tara:strand:+ start:67 stop:222 length:156 start_codon:yes stop_codon:yes gene_type:complete